jgi:hypothetical protein
VEACGLNVRSGWPGWWCIRLLWGLVIGGLDSMDGWVGVVCMEANL